jgi:hypothetical protein
MGIQKTFISLQQSFLGVENAALIEKSMVTHVLRRWTKDNHYLSCGNRCFSRFMFLDMGLRNTDDAGISNGKSS